MVNYGPAKADPTGGNPNGVGTGNGTGNGGGNGGSVTGGYQATPPNTDPLVARWDELVKMVFGADGNPADPNTMYKLAANVALLLAWKKQYADWEVYSTLLALAGPNGSWKGAASEAFGRVAFAITSYMAKTTIAMSTPKYDELLSSAGQAHAQAMADINNIVANNSYELPPIISEGQTEPTKRFDYVTANAQAEQVVKTLGEAY